MSCATSRLHSLGCKCKFTYAEFINADNRTYHYIPISVIHDPICKAYMNQGFSSITSNGPATTKRDPVTISASGYSQWAESDALWELGQSGYTDVVDGDYVTLYDLSQTETRVYSGGVWIQTFSANFASGLGTINCRSSSLPVNESTEKQDTRPGIAEEIKDELKSKRLRDW